MKILTLTFYLILILINFVSGADENAAGELECTLPSNKPGQCRKLTDCPTLLKAVIDNHIEKNEDRIKEYLFKYRCKEVVDKREFCCPDFSSNEETPEEDFLIFPDVNGTDKISSSTISSTVVAETSEPTSSIPNEFSEAPSSTTPEASSTTESTATPETQSPSSESPSSSVEPVVEENASTSDEPIGNESSIGFTEDTAKEIPSSTIETVTTEAISSSTEAATAVPLVDANNEELESHFDAITTTTSTETTVTEKVEDLNIQKQETTTIPEAPSSTVGEISSKYPSEYSENVESPTPNVNLIEILSGPVAEVPVEIPEPVESTTTVPSTSTTSPEVTTEEPIMKTCGIYDGDNEGLFPWSVMLARQNELPCFGTIISENSILSTAECVDKTKEVIKLIKEGPACSFIIFPCTYLELDIETTVKHPNYEPGNDEFNIGLIKLRSPLTFDNYISPICLPENYAELSKENTQSMVTYLTSVTEIFAQNTSNVQLQTEGQCREKLSVDAFKPDNLCSVFTDELDADKTIFTQYGSPLQVNSGSQYYLYGIGVGKETRRSPQKFISIPFYSDWINNNKN